MKLSNTKLEHSVTIEAPLRLCGDFHCENVTYYFPHSKPQQLVEPKAFDVLLQPNLLSVLKINSPKTVKDRLFSDIVLLFEQLNKKFQKRFVC